MTTPLDANFIKRYRDIHPIIGHFSSSPALVTVLYGPSGCGKSTVLRCLAGLEKPEEGTIRFTDKSWLDTASGLSLPPQRRGTGLLFQDYALFPHLTVTDNIGYPLSRMPADKRRHRVAEMIERFRLFGLENHTPDQLSGGQQQRVGLARTLAAEPQLLLLDEPLSAVDATMRETLRQELRSILRLIHTPAIIVTHDWSEVQALADLVILMEKGVPIQRGSPAAIFDRPNTIGAARILGVDTIIAVRVLSSSDATVTVQIGDVVLTAAATLPTPTSLHVGIRAEDVILTPVDHVGVEATGLQGRVTDIQPLGRADRLQIDCGFLLVALLPNRRRTELGIHMGDIVNVTIPPESVLLLLESSLSQQ